MFLRPLFSVFTGRLFKAINIERDGNAITCMCSNYIGYMHDDNLLGTFCNVRELEYLKIRGKKQRFVPLESVRSGSLDAHVLTPDSNNEYEAMQSKGKVKKTESNLLSKPMDSSEPEAHCSKNIDSINNQSSVKTKEEKSNEREYMNDNNISSISLQNVPVGAENLEPNIPIVRVEPMVQPQEEAVRAVPPPPNSAANFFSSYNPMVERDGTMELLLENSFEPLPADFNVNLYSLDVAGYSFSFDDLDFLFD